MRVSDIDKEIPSALPIPSPLPPITPVNGEEEDYDEEEEEERDVVGGEMRVPSVTFTEEDEQSGEGGFCNLYLVLNIFINPINFI